MQKISIKREQSQAGLSFAEREKFRPQVKNKLLLLLALLMTAVTGAWAEEQVVYTLDGTQTASNNAYATAGVVNQGGMTWRVTGNVNQNPWRIGGKSLSGVDRSVWSESALDETVTKVTLEFGTASSITVNSITMMVAGDADFNNVIDSKPVTFSANNTVDVTPTEGKEWKNAYYLFVFNVTVEGSTNKFLQLKSIKFYNDPDAQQQGGGTEPVAGTYTVTMKDGVKDADKWTVKVGEGQAQALPIGGLKGDGSETVTLQYNGRLKVKGVKATSDAAPAKEPATVTTAPTGAAVVGVGKTTALVSGGVADGGTLMYAVTTTNTKPASTDGFSGTVPTAQTITASGTVYVWYYVKGDDTHSDSEIAATAIEVPVADIVWDATNVFNSAHQYEEVSKWESDHRTYEGITISFSGESPSLFTPYGGMGESMLLCYGDEGDSFTFTAPSGKKFCKIEINNNSGINFDKYGDWTQPEDNKIVWSGTAADAVTLGTVYTVANELNSIAFYLSE